jgi:glycine/D-amino acid oxidase-like deaminating enzyme
MIGKIPNAEGDVYVMTGMGASGFMKGAMAGKLLAALMADDERAAQILKPADPRRFRDEAKREL